MNVQDLLDRARRPLNDDDKTRYSDADGLLYLQEAVRTIRRLRPDTFVGNLMGDPADGLTVSSEVPVAFEHYQAVADYVSARWQDKDDDLTGEKSVQWLAMAVGGVS